VLVGRCWEASGAPPFWPWMQSLRGYEGETPPELRGESVAVDSDSARFRLFDATAELLRTASRKQPMLLFLDDLHAADEPSLLLLEFLARELGSMRVLVVGACRDVDPIPGRPVAAMLAAVTREPVTARLTLRGLSEGDVAEYIALAAGELASAELIAALHEETDGNPLFLSETVRLLAVEGRIAIPPSLRDVIARRLTHLSDECNSVLELASILGREFALDVLARMRGEDVLEQLDEAMSAKVVADVPGVSGRLRFAHVLIRDTLYEELTTARRILLHRLAAENLEQLDAEPAELAHHWVAGQEFAKGVEFARRAGDRALALLAYEEAARLYDVALSARPDEPERCELLIARGEAQARSGDTSLAKESFVGAAEIARRLGLSRELARSAVGYGGRIVWVRAGDDPCLVPMLEQALAALPDGEHELRARVLARLAGALRDEPSRDRREALAAEAVAIARQSSDPTVLAYTLDAYGYAILGPDTLAQCLAIARTLGDEAELARDKERVVAGHMLAIMALAPLGQIAATWVELEAAAQHAGELGQRPQVSQAQGIRAMLALAEGRLAEGEALSADRYELGRRALREESVAIHRCHRHSLHDFRGTIAEVEAEIDELAALFPARPVFRCVLAQVHARVGNVELARLALSELPAALPFDQEWLYAMSLLAETAALVQDGDAAAVLYRMLLPWRELNAVDVAEGCRGAVSRYLGLLAATVGRPREAAEHFEHAIRTNERMGFRPWLARAQHDYARLLRYDDPRAAALEAAALATYDEIGAAPA
jgi:tetratricopeptide (TPR) repeat protein